MYKLQYVSNSLVSAMQVSTSVQTYNAAQTWRRHEQTLKWMRHITGFFPFLLLPLNALPGPAHEGSNALPQLGRRKTFPSKCHRMGHTGTTRPDWLLSNHPPSWPHKRTQDVCIQGTKRQQAIVWALPVRKVMSRHGRKTQKQACFGTCRIMIRSLNPRLPWNL